MIGGMCVSVCRFTVTGVQPHRKYFQCNNAHDCITFMLIIDVKRATTGIFPLVLHDPFSMHYYTNTRS